MKRLGIVAMAAGLAAVLVSGAALAAPPAPAPPKTLVVDGTSYSAYKVSGGASHFATPDTNPTAAYIINGHVWTGNGSDNLPCANGIHWIDNANVLTVSHCLEAPPVTTTTIATTTTLATTTTTAPVTTTTAPEVTTTTAPEVTTTTEPEVTTTTVPEVTTTTPEETTTTVTKTVDPCIDSNGDGVKTPDADGDGVEDDVNAPSCELPFTGAGGVLAMFGLVGGLLTLLGGALIYGVDRTERQLL